MRELAAVNSNREMFSEEFIRFLPDNLHVYRAFEKEALLIHAKGRVHYSAYTIIQVLRHHSSLRENGGEWKISNNHTPCLSRLFKLLNPQAANLFTTHARFTRELANQP